MAKFVPAIGDIAGKIGNLVFARNRYGPTIRRRAVPVNTRTIAQRLSRAELSGASAYWRQVIEPAGTANAWNAFAANFPLHQGKGTKSAVYVTGQAFSVAINALRARFGSPACVSPPQTWGTDQPTSVTAAAVGATSITISAIGGVTLDASHVLMVKMTGPLSRGVRFIGKSKYRIIFMGATPALPLALTTSYQAVFGNLPAKGTVVGLAINVIKAYTSVGPPLGLDTACPGMPVYTRIVAS
jgi:hypothetical protein